jgi:hypothetical protein
MKELENKSNEHSDDDDVMFGSIDEDVGNAAESAHNETVEPVMKSFWGGSRVVKQKQNNNGRSNNQMF